MSAADTARILHAAIDHLVSGRTRDAQTLLHIILRDEPSHPAAHQLLGRIALNAGQLMVASQYMAKSTTLDPTNAGWFHQHADLFVRLGQPEQAIAAYQKALALDPELAPAAISLAYLFLERNRIREIKPLLQAPLAAHSDNPELYACLGIVASLSGDPASALFHFQHAATLSPDDPKFHACLGNCFRDLARLPEAQAAYETALRLAPNVPIARLNYGMTLLLQGDFQNGWPAWESRPTALALPRNSYKRPVWKGEPVQSLLLWAEQGFGDVIQCVRYLPLLHQCGIHVCLAVQPELIDLLKDIARPENLFPADGMIPLCDAQQLVMSLPGILGTTLASIPTHTPYLHADPARRQKFADLLATSPAPEGHFKVGLAWSGRPTHTNDANRSLDPALLAPLASVPNFTFYSLQLNPRTPAPAALQLRDFTGHISDFADTAALISHLDLVISVDTAVAHLAGAMAKPVWTLLPFLPDWRWMMNRSDSPWYPTMQLFRQPTRNDWPAVIKAVTEQLHHFPPPWVPRG